MFNPDSYRKLTTVAQPLMGKGGSGHGLSTPSFSGVDQALLTTKNPSFSPFVRHVQPDPIPSKGQFYAEEIRRNWSSGMKQGGVAYKKELKRNPIKRTLVWASGIGLGLLMSAFGNPPIATEPVKKLLEQGKSLKDTVKEAVQLDLKKKNDTAIKQWMTTHNIEALTLGDKLALGIEKHVNLRKYVQMGFMASLLIYPVLKATQIFPELEEAYNLAKEGNPKQGREQFKRSFSQVSYSLFNEFLKPLSVAGLSCLFFLLPRIIKTPTGVTQQLLHTLSSLVVKLRPPGLAIRKKAIWNYLPKPEIVPNANLYTTLSKLPPFRWLEKLHQTVTQWGLGQELKLAKRFDWL